jgi:hypothetical protein
MSMKTKGVTFCGLAEDVIIDDAQEIVRGKVGTDDESFAIHKTFYHGGSSQSGTLVA